MKKKYESPCFEVIKFEVSDVILSSNENNLDKSSIWDDVRSNYKKLF